MTALAVETEVVTMKRVLFSLLTVSFFGVVGLPASADQANVQNSTQVVTQDGAYNSSVQVTDQQIRSNSIRDSYYGDYDRDNVGNVQGASQDALQKGLGNVNGQVTQQRVDVNKEYRDRYRY
jgi:protein-disulfide isomerase